MTMEQQACAWQEVIVTNLGSFVFYMETGRTEGKPQASSSLGLAHFGEGFIRW